MIQLSFLLNLHCDLDLENNNIIVTQSTPVYDESGCKKISSSAVMVETVIIDQMSLHCDPELEDSQPIFLHNTLAHHVASSYQVWLQKVQQLREYRPDEH